MDQATAEKIATSRISGISIPVESPKEVAEAAPQAAPEQTPQAGDQPLGESEQQPVESETEEIEFDGIKFALPKEHIPKVKEALLREADYTRKTQELSERGRVISEHEKMFQAQAQFHKDSIDDIAQIRALDQAIAQYANVNWMAMQTDELMRTRLQYDQLKEARQKATETLNQKWSTFNQNREQQMKALEKAGRDEISRKISGFNEAQEKDLKDYARKAGYPEAKVAQMFYDPLDVYMIWKARQYDQLEGTKGAIQQRVNKAPPVVKPGASMPQKSDAEKVKVEFFAAKDKAKKEKLGMDLLARKMRI